MNKIKKTSKRGDLAGPDQIAVIGIGCWYPGAQNPQQLWENILARRTQFRRMPDVRLPISEYQDDDKGAPDKTYGKRAAVIDGYAFDWAKKRIPRQTYESTDLAHWFALDVALQMLEDAGYAPGDLPLETTQIVVGNTLTGEFTRSNTLRSRWPFVNKILSAVAGDMQMPEAAIDALSKNMERSFKSVFAPINEDTLAGGLANTIAGRICNYLNVNGGGYIVDGACSSSLIAIHTAAANLASGAIDFAIAGGVDISLDPFELVGFAKTGALTPTEMSVYDKRGNGFIPGEGCGFVGMKRLTDALRDGDKIYAVIDGWGISSDGKGGITAPSVNGQSMALKRAYRQAGVAPKDIDFIEGHGTGTAVGDRTELLGIARALDSADISPRSCGVTSFKSIVGHTKAAAGVGAFIKAAIAVNQRVIPPTAGCSLPHDAFSNEAGAIYPVLRGAVLPAERQLRAGVSAMGFGGINVHVTLRSGDEVLPGYQPAAGTRAALASRQDSEVFCFATSSLSALVESLQRFRETAADASIAELADTAAAMNQATDRKAHIRAALVAGSVEEVLRKSALLLTLIETPPAQGKTHIDQENMIALGNGVESFSLGYIFPGQGSQKLNMARTLVQRFDWAEELVQNADRWAADIGSNNLAATIYPDLDKHITKSELEPLQEQLKQTELAQPAIVLASLLWLKFLDRLGLSAAAVMGHSLGELSAFHAAGAFDEKTLIQLAALRGKLMATGGAAGAMLSLGCARDQAEQLMAEVKDGALLVIANINSATQTVISGESAAIEALFEAAASANVAAHRLPVSNAFHSPLMEKAADAMRKKAPLSGPASALTKVLISSCDGARIDSDVDLRQHFSAQITSRVDFVAALRSLQQHCDAAFEVGPGRVLSNLVPHDTGWQAYPVEKNPESFNDLNWLVAIAHVHSQALNWGALYENRVIRPLVAARDLHFVVNPCERPFERVPEADRHGFAGQLAAGGLRLDVPGVDLARYFDHRGGFIADVIKADLKSSNGTPSPRRTLAAAPVKSYAALGIAPRQVQANVMNANPEREIKAIVAGMTGFAEDSISMSQHIADDLNLDSLKSAELGAKISARFHGSADVSPSFHAAQTLGDYLPLIGAAHAASASPAVAQAAAGPDARAVVLRLAAAATGFAPDQITLDMNLLDDLNLDSIKAGSLVGDACAILGVAGQLDPAVLTAMTLGQLAQAIDAVRLPAAATTATAGTPSALQVLLALASEYTGFPAESVQASYSFVDDLNLDSIKFGALVSDAAARLGLEGKVNAGEVAHASIEALAAHMQQLIVPQASMQTAIAKPAARADHPGPDWVRSFGMRLLPSPLPVGETAAMAFQGQVVAIQRDQEDQALAYALGQHLSQKGATVLMYDAATLEQESRRDIGHFVVFLRRTHCAAAMAAEDLETAVKRLRPAAVVSARQDRCVSLSYVQFDGIGEEPAGATGDLHSSCANAFAASVHLERPALQVRVLDFSTSLAQHTVAENIVNELRQPQRHIVSRYDAGAQRHLLQPALAEQQFWPARSIAWSASDVVLVTGGAKGITAECAFAFAKACGIKMALVGSAPHVPGDPASTEISQTLARFAAAGLVAQYFQCDIASEAAVRTAAGEIERSLGKITGLVHGAGLNKPRRVEQCSQDEAVKEIGPKLRGIVNLTKVLDPAALKLIVGLSSIIGVTGMDGNAWYAFSNEALTLCLQKYQQAHLATQTVSLAYSVWAEVGMGAKMGSTAHLAKLGISAIPAKLGVASFMHSVLHRSPATLVVIASRLGGLDTWRKPAAAAGQAGRFIGELAAFEPGVEIVNRVRLSLDEDLYLRDHYYRGVYLFPTVFGLEAMAQTVARLLGIEGFASLELRDINLQRPIIVTGEGGTLIQVSAQVAERSDPAAPFAVTVGIRTQNTGFQRDHFSATFVLQEQGDGADLDRIALPKSPTDIEPLSELYGGLLFQGPLFQRLRHVWSMEDSGSVIDIERRAGDNYFAPSHSSRMMLGDPSFRDVLLQSAQLSEKGIYLPVHIGALHIYSLHCAETAKAYAQNRIVSRVDDELVCDVVAVSEQHAPIERLAGYRLKRMEYDEGAAMPSDYVHPGERDARLLRAALDQAGARLKVRTPEHVLSFYPQLSLMDRSRRRLSELPLFSEAILNAFPVNRNFELDQIEVHWQEDGKPVLRGLDRQGVNVSLSHDKAHCLCVAGDDAQGCDIEPITRRSMEQWMGLLGAKRRDMLNQLIAAGDSLDDAGTRLWCAVESVKKAVGGLWIDLQISARDESSVLFDGSGEQGSVSVLTTALSLTRNPKKMVAMVVKHVPAGKAIEPLASALSGQGQQQQHSARADLLDPLVYSHMASGPHGQPKPSFRFRVTFKDTTTLRNSAEYPVFANWMGNIRELGIIDVAKQLVPDFASGRWGMVTNHSDIVMLEDIHCLDVIEGRMYISRSYGKLDSSIDMHFEWMRVNPDGTQDRVALSNMATTWVEIVGHGAVEVRAFPAYLQDFIASYLPGREQAGLPALAQDAGSATILGDRLYEAPNAPKVEPELMSQVFSTTMAESNLVGNIYFSNYYHWQKKLIDLFFHGIAPELFTAQGRMGEFHCVKSEVRHLREAMPFDRIEVVMALKSLHRQGIALHFDFYKLAGDGERIKLAFGQYQAVWVKGGDAAQSSDIPERFTSALLEKLAVSA